MAANSRLEDVTINMTTTANSQILRALYFNDGTAGSSKFRTGVISVNDSAFTGCSLYGAYVDASGTTAQSANNTLQRTSMTVTGYTGTTKIRGIYNTGVNRISFRDCNIYAVQTGGTIGSTACIGLETDLSGAIIEARTSTISGTGNDISQGVSGSQIILALSDLVNRTANSLGLTESTQTSDQNYSMIIATNKNPGQGTYYIAPGTYFYTNDVPSATTPINIQFNQPTLINSISVSPNTAISGGVTFTVNRVAASGNPGITTMSVYLPGTTTIGVFSNNVSMRVGTGDSYNVSFTANFTNSDVVTANISLI
jgi:hypothetical protein